MEKEISKMAFSELRKVAKRLGVNPAGKRQADLIREVEKKIKIKAGKGTPADPRAAKKAAVKGQVRPAKAAPPPEPEEDEDDGEEALEPVKRGRGRPPKETPKKEDPIDVLKVQFIKLEERVALLEETMGEGGGDQDEDAEDSDADEDEEVPVIKGKKPVEVPKKKASKPVEDDEEDDDFDPDEPDEDEEDDEDEDEPPPKKAAKGKKPVKDDDEESGDIEVTTEELATMNLEQMKELAKKINKTGVAKIDSNVASPRILRQRILEVMKKFAEEGGGDEEEAEDDEAVELPKWVKAGLKVEVEVDDEWKRGKVDSIDGAEILVEIDGEDDIAVVDGENGYEDIRPVLQRKPKER